LVNLQIGNGTILSGIFISINWNSDNYFLQIEMDPTGGSNYQLMGTSQLLPVPFSLHSNTANIASGLILTDENGNSYSMSIDTLGNLKTIDLWDCGDSLTDVRDGQKYATVLIGYQCWLRQNLNFGIMTLGSESMMNNGVIEKYCHGDEITNCDVYGGLYQWDEIMNYLANPGVQGICPDGWHIPSDAEWGILINHLGGENIAGGKMKEAGNTHWEPPNNGATNSSNFTALPAGERHYDGYFVNLGYSAWFWSSTQINPPNPIAAWDRYLDCQLESVGRYNNYKTRGYSLRCIKY